MAERILSGSTVVGGPGVEISGRRKRHGGPVLGPQVRRDGGVSTTPEMTDGDQRTGGG